MIDVTSYGAVGDGVTNDYSAFASAITAAVNTNDYVYVPLGNYFINVSSAPLLIPSNSNVLIQGVGISSRLKFGPEGLSVAAVGFRVDTSATLGLHDLKLEGPSTLSGSGQLIAVQTWTNATRLDMIRCTFLLSYACVKGEGGNSATYIYGESCSFDASGQGFLLVDQVGEVNSGIVELTNCTFNMTDFSPLPVYGASQHNMYVNGGWALTIDGCDFVTTGESQDGKCINGYGGNGAKPLQPWYIHNTTFRTKDQLQTSEYVATYISNCTFSYKSNGILVREGGAFINYCTFSPHTLAGGNAISQYSGPAVVVCEDSTFSGGLNQAGVYASYITRTRTDGAEWIFRRCTFGGSANDDSVCSTYVGYTNANFRFEDCTFGACGKDFGYIRCGTMFFQRCRFNVAKILYVFDGLSGSQLSYGNVTITLDGCFGQGTLLLQVNDDAPWGSSVTFTDEHNNNLSYRVQASTDPRTVITIP